MALYYFDVRNSRFMTTDDVGMECADRDDVGTEALRLLCMIGRDDPLTHLHNQLAVIVRDAGNRVVVVATAGLAVTWIDPA